MKVLIVLVVCALLVGCGDPNYVEKSPEFNFNETDLILVKALIESVVLPTSVKDCGNDFIYAFLNEPGSEGFATIKFIGTWNQISCAINNSNYKMSSITFEHFYKIPAVN